MHITALIQVVNHLKELSCDKSLLEKYEKLSESVREASEVANEEIISKINLQKNDLCEFLADNEPAHWGYSSYSLYEKLNAEKIFGRSAADSINDLIEKDKNYSRINARLTRSIKILTRFSENISTFHTLFQMILPAGEMVSTQEIQKPALLLYFEGKLSIRSIADLERYSRLWDNIISAFCNLADTDNPPIDICNINNGNIILRVSLNSFILTSMMTGVTEILSVLPFKLKIKKIQNELSQLNLQNDFAGALEDEIEYLVNTKALNAASKISVAFPIGNSEEIVSRLARCLKQILSFVEKGGKIEYHFGESSFDTATPNRVMIEAYHTVNELELIRNLTSSYN